MGTESDLGTVGAARRPVDPVASARANRRWWDADADAYHDAHGRFLGIDDFVWCPERVREEDAHLLGSPASLAGKLILEVGCGSAMCSRWLAARGARTVGFDISAGMLRHAADGARTTGIEVDVVQADAQRMPFATEAFDLAFSAFGAVPFVDDSAGVMREIARVVRPGGRWVFAVSHPIRWVFPDDHGPDGLTARMSYFDRHPYVEFDEQGAETYVEHHRTMGDRIREIVAAGLHVLDVIEPEWPEDLTDEWGQWSPLRGALVPGTAIFVTQVPA